MKTAQEYIESLRGRKRELYVLGEKVEDFTGHPILRHFGADFTSKAIALPKT